MPADRNDDLRSLEAGLDALELAHDPRERRSMRASILPPLIGAGLVLALWQLAVTAEIGRAHV